MDRRGAMRVPSTFVIAVVASLQSAQAPVRSPGPPTADLVAAVRAAYDTRGFTMRARLVTDSGGRETVVQIRALGRRDQTSSRVLYQALWPAAAKGRAAYLQRDTRQGLSGFLFQWPDTLTPLSDDRLSEPFLESALCLEDLAEDFWSWPAPTAGADAIVEGQPCRIIEFRPPPATKSDYERIRTCISPRKSLALSIEKIRRDGRIARRLVVKRTVKGENGRWAPVRIAVEDLERHRTTFVEVSKGERDIPVSLAEFSLSKIKSLGR